MKNMYNEVKSVVNFSVASPLTFKQKIEEARTVCAKAKVNKANVSDVTFAIALARVIGNNGAIPVSTLQDKQEGAVYSNKITRLYIALANLRTVYDAQGVESKEYKDAEKPVFAQYREILKEYAPGFVPTPSAVIELLINCFANQRETLEETAIIKDKEGIERIRHERGVMQLTLKSEIAFRKFLEIEMGKMIEGNTATVYGKYLDKAKEKLAKQEAKAKEADEALKNAK